MTHDRFTQVLVESGFHRQRVERVAEVVETAITDRCAADGGLPGSLDRLDRLVMKREHQPFRLPPAEKQGIHFFGEGDFAAFSARRLGTGNEEQLAVEVDMFPTLIENLAAPHAGLQAERDDFAKVRCSRGKDLLFVVWGED